jgi:hypothetical protein
LIPNYPRIFSLFFRHYRYQAARVAEESFRAHSRRRSNGQTRTTAAAQHRTGGRRRGAAFSIPRPVRAATAGRRAGEARAREGAKSTSSAGEAPVLVRYPLARSQHAHALRAALRAVPQTFVFGTPRCAHHHPSHGCRRWSAAPGISTWAAAPATSRTRRRDQARAYSRLRRVRQTPMSLQVGFAGAPRALRRRSRPRFAGPGARAALARAGAASKVALVRKRRGAEASLPTQTAPPGIRKKRGRMGKFRRAPAQRHAREPDASGTLGMAKCSVRKRREGRVRYYLPQYP